MYRRSMYLYCPMLVQCWVSPLGLNKGLGPCPFGFLNGTLNPNYYYYFSIQGSVDHHNQQIQTISVLQDGHMTNGVGVAGQPE